MTDVAKSHGERVKRRILEMGMRLWMVDPSYVTARRIASELKMTHSAVLYHFGTMRNLQNAIAYYAVQAGESRVIVHLIASNHSTVATMDEAARMVHMRAAQSARVG